MAGAAGSSEAVGGSAEAGTRGESGGSAGSASGASGEAGEAGSAGASELVPCNSQDGSGCGAGKVCLDVESDNCATGAPCKGYCAAIVPPMGCAVELAQCMGTVTCPADPVTCPAGLVNSIVDECWGPCVPADCCACASQRDCQVKDVTCDLATGRCVLPAAPEPRCSLPVNPRPCQGYARTFAFVDGACQELQNGLCNDNDNGFASLEECLRRCEGLPQQGECPPGRVAELVCLACGPLGGCAEHGTVCAQTCTTSDDCSFGSCAVDTCQMAFCI